MAKIGISWPERMNRIVSWRIEPAVVEGRVGHDSGNVDYSEGWEPSGVLEVIGRGAVVSDRYANQVKHESREREARARDVSKMSNFRAKPETFPAKLLALSVSCCLLGWQKNKTPTSTSQDKQAQALHVSKPSWSRWRGAVLHVHAPVVVEEDPRTAYPPAPSWVLLLLPLP